ncbi:MAG: sigma-54 dependent transcriptional regulator [Azoarcus sp.]|jgi:sigma-54-specific transcriptional regulator|nr:sigma-54 dependent transcriptional regulator [Azoarcus sp.]
MDKILTLPDTGAHVLSIRAKAQVFHDPASVEVLETVELVAPSGATVLIVGDTGTGKELLARHIHEKSGRGGPFVAVNCGAFSENLIEAELFGHEPGAFTGAQGARAGWFEAAQHGTLFLDEIGDLPLAMQVKLLRVIQERQVVRLGSRRPLDIDVRLVTATNIDLARAVAAGNFRRDLYYRLNVAVVHLPLLRERPDDILPLARHFMEMYRIRLRLDKVDISPQARQALLDYEWPGNIRELENVIHYALIVSRNGLIQSGDLRLHKSVSGVHDRSAPPPEQEISGILPAAIRSLLDTGHPAIYEHVEETLVRQAFARCNGNQVKTASLLGVSRNVVRALLKRFGLLNGAARPVESELSKI